MACDAFIDQGVGWTGTWRAEEAARSVEGATSDVAGIGMWLCKRARSSKDKQSKARHVKSRETGRFDLGGRSLCCTLTMYVMTYRRLGVESRQRKKPKYRSIIDDWTMLRDRDGVSLLAARDCTRDVGGELRCY